MAYVFVYGTLKRGFPLNYALSTAKYIGEFFTESEYNLIDLGAFPAMIEATPGGRVYGEVYDAPPALIQYLDLIEQVNKGLYERKRIVVKDDKRRKAKAWVYLCGIEFANATVIRNGRWEGLESNAL